MECAFSFLYVCGDPDIARADVSADMHASEGREIGRTSSYHTWHPYYKCIGSSLERLLNDEASRIQQCRCIYIRTDSAMELSVQSFIQDLPAKPIIQHETCKGCATGIIREMDILEAIENALGSKQEAKLYQKCQLNHFATSDQDVKKGKWANSFTWLDTYVSSIIDENCATGGEIVVVILSNHGGLLADNPDSLNTLITFQHGDKKFSHVIVLLAGTADVTDEDLSNIAEKISTKCHYGPAKIWFHPSALNRQTDACRLLEAHNIGRLLTYLAFRFYEEPAVPPFSAYTQWDWFQQLPTTDYWDAFLRCPIPVLRLGNLYRKPRYIDEKDHRVTFQGGRKGSFIRCDHCHQRIEYGSDVVKYKGGFVDKTWNREWSGAWLSKRDLVFMWYNGFKVNGKEVNYTWCCVECYQDRYECTSEEAEIQLELYKFADTRRARREAQQRKISLSLR